MYELTLILVGLLAGSLLTEGMVLVPFWRSLPMDKFYELHGSGGPRLFRYFAPLTALAVVASIVHAVTDGDIGSWIAASLCCLTFASFFVFFRAVNNKLSAHAYNEADLPKVLERWAIWHHARTFMMLAAFAALSFVA
ncbi:DUF1772 domain-containing protein [Yoonia sp. SS1-5]|uniref:DUF1772 domain-containing protein n=1 Tax=Yoonia rhodophyticola TaxID=3137370 RepID=A0AAN0NKU7_9RHOB